MSAKWSTSGKKSSSLSRISHFPECARSSVLFRSWYFTTSPMTPNAQISRAKKHSEAVLFGVGWI
jgi:hypothetical protein